MSKKRNHFHRLLKKRHASRSFRNPYFRSSSKRKWKILIAGILFIVLIISLTTFLLTSARFAFATISVEGTETIPPKEITQTMESYFAERRWLFFHASNRWLFNETDAKERLENLYAFESLAIQREENHIHIVLEEKTSSLLWQTGEGIYLVDLQGIVIAWDWNIDRVRIPVRVDNRNGCSTNYLGGGGRIDQFSCLVILMVASRSLNTAWESSCSHSTHLLFGKKQRTDRGLRPFFSSM